MADAPWRVFFGIKQDTVKNLSPESCCFISLGYSADIRHQLTVSSERYFFLQWGEREIEHVTPGLLVQRAATGRLIRPPTYVSIDHHRLYAL